MKFEQNNGLNKVGYVEELYFNIPYILNFLLILFSCSSVKTGSIAQPHLSEISMDSLP